MISSLLLFFWRGIVPAVVILDPNSFGKNIDFSKTIATIMECGISHYIITADFLDRLEDRSGKSGNFGLRIFPTGHTIPIKKTWGYGLGKTVIIYDLSARSFSWILMNIGIYTPISPLISTASLLGTKLLFWAMKEKINELLNYFPPEILQL